ncbi:MAG: hypothetical protein ACOY3P_24525 [Planctomycetota bacterium]
MLDARRKAGAMLKQMQERGELADRGRRQMYQAGTLTLSDLGLTRKQSTGQSDTDIDRDGLQAELAACLIIAPGYRDAWLARDGANRGCDLPVEWTGLPKSIEVKQTRYHDARRGYLLVRPPRWTPGDMRPEYIDDCLYVLMHGANGLYTMLGWTDRQHLLTAGELNPVPIRYGQRECWGIHWSRLRQLEEIGRPDIASNARECR